MDGDLSDITTSRVKVENQKAGMLTQEGNNIYSKLMDKIISNINISITSPKIIKQWNKVKPYKKYKKLHFNAKTMHDKLFDMTTQ